MPGADSVPTLRRVQYALGYLDLGMINEASDELEAVSFRDRFAMPVMEARLALHSQAQHWDIVERYAHMVLQRDRQHIQAWISLGCAVRRLKGFEVARDTLLEAERIVGEKHGIIHYNLACYHCLLGNVEAAKDRLACACRIEDHWKAAALDDDDLKPMWDAIGTMK